MWRLYVWFVYVSSHSNVSFMKQEHSVQLYVAITYSAFGKNVLNKWRHEWNPQDFFLSHSIYLFLVPCPTFPPDSASGQTGLTGACFILTSCNRLDTIYHRYQVLNLGWVNRTLLGKRVLADVIRLMILRWGDYLGFSGWAKMSQVSL